jgi:predicted DNA-binding transcriptional regulator AlpA
VPPPDATPDLDALADAIAARLSERLEPPAMLDQVAAYRYAGLSRSAWFRLRSAGRTPAPVDAGDGVLRWRRADLDHWVERMRPNRARRSKGRSTGGEQQC